MPHGPYLRGSGCYRIDGTLYGRVQGFSDKVVQYTCSTVSQEGPVPVEIVVLGTTKCHATDSIILVPFGKLLVFTSSKDTTIRLVTTASQLQLLVDGDEQPGPEYESQEACNTVCDAVGRVTHFSTPSEMVEESAEVWGVWSIDCAQGVRVE